MMHKDTQILIKIMEEIATLNSFAEHLSEQEFYNSEVIRRAAAMTLINIGELVKSLSEEIRRNHTDVPWRAIAGLRDIAAHKYQTLHIEDLWATVSNDIPSLQNKIRYILNNPI